MTGFWNVLFPSFIGPTASPDEGDSNHQGMRAASSAAVGTRAGASMTDRYYRCYFIKGDHIATVEELHCSDDSAALLYASSILNASEFLSIELWQEGRMVGQLSRPDGTAERKRAS